MIFLLAEKRMKSREEEGQREEGGGGGDQSGWSLGRSLIGSVRVWSEFRDFWPPDQ